jgi:hypothetical protein
VAGTCGHHVAAGWLYTNHKNKECIIWLDLAASGTLGTSSILTQFCYSVFSYDFVTGVAPSRAGRRRHRLRRCKIHPVRVFWKIWFVFPLIPFMLTLATKQISGFCLLFHAFTLSVNALPLCFH